MRYVFIIVLAALVFHSTPAFSAKNGAGRGGASAILPIKARVVRCVTNEERAAMCSQENLCCNLPIDWAATEKDGNAHSAYAAADENNAKDIE